ncbi:endonuclease/exonuclease/phosphatase family protein [Devosia chinhatensis]|uniref:endonuclease/exonuclease/phosphatase family protein n=1 Tax=Devosia chinhatensis TaxID=429727 RepID=UPI0006984E90|nr:endonuclease/exonuclease/phosphatase family protein [Devosia chinhatensis]
MLSKAEFRGGLLAVSAILIVVLLVVSLSPGLPGELLLQTLRFHLLAAGLGLAVLAILFGARWRGLIVLLIVLASGAHGALFVREFYERRTPVAEAPAAQFRFLSFNVLNGNRQAAQLVDAVIADPPDVMLVMETPGIETHLDRLAQVLPYRLGCAVTTTCDISLLSRFPIEDGEIRRPPPYHFERLAIGRIVVDGQPITIAGIHLSKPYFDQSSWIELHSIGRILSAVEGPMVVAGDFNSAFWTEPMANLGAQLDLAPGPWPAATWPVRLGPLGVPIDNVFTSGNARLLTLEAGENYGSNHRPLWADVAIYPGS